MEKCALLNVLFLESKVSARMKTRRSGHGRCYSVHSLLHIFQDNFASEFL